MQAAPNAVSIALFFVVIAVSLAITAWAAKRSKTTAQLYAAGGGLTAWQNGLAIAGDILSAATFLGTVGIYFTAGYDAVYYTFAPMAGFMLLLGIITGPLRKLGRYTFGDVAALRLSPRPMRILAALSALAVTIMYLVVQIVGAGSLIEILFGIRYVSAVVIVGTLMVIYVAFGGMLATSWVQIIKAGIIFVGIILMSVLALAQTGFSLDALYAKAASAHRLHESLFQPGGLKLSVSQSISLSVALALGIPGMPHLLMRFFTVPDAHTARRSLVIGMVVMATAYALVFLIIGPAGAAFITGNPAYVAANGVPFGSANMV